MAFPLRQPHRNESYGRSPYANNLLLVLPARRRRVLIVEDTTFNGGPICRILRRLQFHVLACGTDDVAETVRSMSRFDLAIIPLAAQHDLARAQLQALRTLPAFVQTPVLAIAGRGAAPLDCAELRRLGVVGVASRDASLDHLAFRVRQILPGTSDQRRHVRVPVSFDVQVATDRAISTQHAENLSTGGIRLRSGLALEVNAAVTLSFRLPSCPSETVSVEARVIHCQAAPGATGSYTVGLFFLSPAPRARVLIEAEVEQLLTATDETAQGRPASVAPEG